MNNDILFSSTGALIAEILTLPICTIKTNYQVQNQLSIPQITKSIYSRFGIQGFYKASYVAIASQVVSTSTKYAFYNVIKNYRKTEKNELLNNIINGAISGIGSILLTHPLDVIKNHHQRHVKFIPTLKIEGPKLLYRGIDQSIFKSMLISSILFPIYDFYSSKTDNVLLRSGLTTLTVTSISHPLDLMKVRKIAGKPIFLGFEPQLYYHGISLNLMRAIPHFMITMVTIEYLQKKFI